MIHGAYYPPKFRERYNSERLKRARGRIEAYPHIKEIFGNLTNFEGKTVYNQVFTDLADRGRDMFGRTSKRYEKNLQRIESALESYLKLAPKGEKSKFIAKIKSNDPYSVNSALLELDIFSILYQNYPPEDITISPTLTSGSEPDFGVSLEDTDCVIEVTSLGKTETENKLKNVFNNCSKQIFEMLPRRVIMCLEVDTSKLIWNKELDVAASESLILNSFEKTNLLSFAKYPNFYHLDILRRFGDKGKKLKDCIEKMFPWETMDVFLSKNLKNPDFYDFLNTKIEEFVFSPIEKLSIRKGFYGMVEIHSQNVFPSATATAERRVFLEHIKRRLSEKIKRGQRDPNKFNVIILQADNWSYLHYSDESQLFSDEEYAPIKAAIEEVLDDMKVTDLSAILLFDFDIRHNRVILNPHSASEVNANQIKKLVLGTQ